MSEAFQRRFPIPEHDGKGNVVITYPDDRKETISLISAIVQAKGWSEAVAGAALFHAARKG